MDEIEKIYQEIDKIDDSLVELLIKRFTLAKQVIQIKKTNNIELEDSDREEAIKSRYFNVDLPEGYIDKFFSNLFDEERKLWENG